RVGKADVIYLAASQPHFLSLARIITTVRPDVVYLNSFFSTQFSVVAVALRRLYLIPAVPFILAPRGEFSAGALSIKPTKKHAFLSAARAPGLHRGIFWQASSAFEAAEIEHQIVGTNGGRAGTGRRARIVVAPDLLAAAP